MTISAPLWFLFTSILWLRCHAAIWETEEAYIFDGSVQVPPKIQDLSKYDSCTDTVGINGYCVPEIKCDNIPHSMDLQSYQEILFGMERYLNDTQLTTCHPGGRSVKLQHVCCTTLMQSNMVKVVALKEYENQNSGNFTDGLVNEIPSAEASTELEGKIIHGTVAKVGEFPFIVSIFYRGSHLCGGSLLDSNWVLSAAHCFGQDINIYDIVVKVGDHDVTKTTEAVHQDIRVAKAFVHKGFVDSPGQFRDDVALLQLQTPVVAASNIRSIILHDPSSPNAPPPDIDHKMSDATVSGWGQFSCTEMHCPSSPVLRKAVLPLITNDHCNQIYRGTGAPPITAGMVCAGGYNKQDACRGDSGGPLVVYHNGKTYQIGLTSWGIGCGQYPGVYTRVSKYLNWIKKHKASGNRGHETHL